MSPGTLPPLGRCALCGHDRHLSVHRSTRDGLPRNVCTPCYSTATLAEETGHPVDWQQAVTWANDDDLLFWLRGER